MNIGLNIRKVREIKGFSQEYMANELEISQRHYSRFEQNETELSVNKLNQIASILGVTGQQLLGFDERFIFQNCETAFGNNQNYYAFSDKERELYETRINHLESEVTFLRTMVEK